MNFEKATRIFGLFVLAIFNAAIIFYGTAAVTDVESAINLPGGAIGSAVFLSLMMRKKYSLATLLLTIPGAIIGHCIAIGLNNYYHLLPI